MFDGVMCTYGICMQGSHDVLRVRDPASARCLRFAIQSVHPPAVSCEEVQVVSESDLVNKPRRSSHPPTDATMSARLCTILLALAAQGSRAAAEFIGRRSFINSACVATCGATAALAVNALPAGCCWRSAASRPQSLFRQSSIWLGCGRKARTQKLRLAVRLVRSPTQIGVLASRSAPVRCCLRCPYELDGTVEFMWVKDSKGRVIAAKKFVRQTRFPRRLLPACLLKVTAVAKCAERVWEGSVTAP